MGMRLFSSSKGDNISRSIINFSKSKVEQAIADFRSLPNPDPSNYKIIRNEIVAKYLIVEIKYLDCTNYEGNKVLVFQNCTLDDLINQKLIDPHFSESKNFISPIARFEPTEIGWSNAIRFARA